jgi:hypothetical protein
MIATKAVAAILMTSLGSFAAGTAAYMEVNPPLPAHEPRPYVPERPAPVAHHEARVVTSPSDEATTVVIEPVVIESRKHPAPKAAPRAAPVTQAACSEWQDLATGPAGRKVRMLCPH